MAAIGLDKSQIEDGLKVQVYSKFGTGTMNMHQSAAFAANYAFSGYIENNTERLVKDLKLYRKAQLRMLEV